MFSINDRVDVKGREMPVYGKITEILDKKAIVHFRIPRDPKNDICALCDWPGFLQICGNTGEVVCMRSGCGHGHGFEERDEIISLDKLINISTQRKKEEINKLLSNLRYKMYEIEIMLKSDKLTDFNQKAMIKEYEEFQNRIMNFFSIQDKDGAS